MTYTRVNWQDLPSTATPRNATNFNKMDSAIKEHDDMLLGNKAIEKIVAGSIEGKNLFDKTDSIEFDKSYTTSGATTDSSGSFIQTSYIEVKPSTKYTLSASASSTFRICEYANDKTFITRQANSSVSTITYTTSATTKYIRFSGTTAVIDTIQIELGENATEYDKFNRYGYNSVDSMGNIVVDDVKCKNLAKPLRYGYYNYNTGVYTYSTTYQCSSSPIYVEKNTSYVFSIDGTGVGGYIYSYDSNNNFLERTQVGSSTNYVYTPASNVAYFNYAFKDGTISQVPLNSKTQIEKGSKITSYVPYKSFDATGYVLWTNPSSTSEFAGQSITLNDAIEKYKYYEIIYLPGTNTQFAFSTGKIPINYKAKLTVSMFYNYGRDVSSITGNTLTFGDCGRYTTYGSNTTTTTNANIIPMILLAYK